MRFERGVDAYLMAIDGTWRRSCTILEVSQTRATLRTEALGGLSLKEFFLVLSSMGVAYRRCSLESINGNELCVNFLQKHDSAQAEAKRERLRHNTGQE